MTWDKRLPAYTKSYGECTLDELLALLELLEYECRTEWCVTLILPAIQEMRLMISERDGGALALRAHDAQADIRDRANGLKSLVDNN